jgi:hypothetical protein
VDDAQWTALTTQVRQLANEKGRLDDEGGDQQGIAGVMERLDGILDPGRDDLSDNQRSMIVKMRIVLLGDGEQIGPL